MRGDKINLPQVEKASEKPPKPAKSFPDKSKYPKDFGCNISNLASTLTFPYEGQKDCRLEKQTWLEVPLPKTASERLSPEIVKVPDCQSCKSEKRIRSNYDKILLQTKMEKEALQLKVNELEDELRRREEVSKKAKEEQEDITINLDQTNEGCVIMDGCDNNPNNKCAVNWGKYRKLEKSNKDKQEKIDCLLIEIEKLNANLSTRLQAERNQEQLFNSKKSKLVSDMEDLKSQFEKAKERDILKVSCLEREKVETLTHLDNANTELEKLRKRRSLVIAELQKEKDCCLLEIERLKAYSEKVMIENASLTESIRVLQQEMEKRSMSSIFSPQVYAARAEVLLISHQSFPENTHAGAADHTFPEICSCGRSLQNLSSSSNKSAVTQAEEAVTVKEIYKQMKRERNLLLDVMVIMYERRWFVDEAIPHVRRALRKCGALSAHTE
ncbi:rho-associated protein kinase 2-like isoform X2 [Pseudophryne corroboree]